jgi:hypothetical protein
MTAILQIAGGKHVLPLPDKTLVGNINQRVAVFLESDKPALQKNLEGVANSRPPRAAYFYNLAQSGRSTALPIFRTRLHKALEDPARDPLGFRTAFKFVEVRPEGVLRRGSFVFPKGRICLR